MYPHARNDYHDKHGRRMGSPRWEVDCQWKLGKGGHESHTGVFSDLLVFWICDFRSHTEEVWRPSRDTIGLSPILFL